MTSTDIYSLPLAYVYKVTNKETGEFYIGSRTAKIVRTKLTPEQDFLVKYFTSGKLQKDIKVNLSKYYGEILFRSNEIIFINNSTQFVVLWYEQLLIRENIKNPLCKNNKYFDVDTSKLMWFVDNSGRIFTEAHKVKIKRVGPENGMFGKTHSEETKEKLSNIKKLLIGPLSPRYGKSSYEKAISVNGIKYKNMKIAEIETKISWHILHKLLEGYRYVNKSKYSNIKVSYA